MNEMVDILQKDGTIKKVSESEFNKYIEDMNMHTEDIKNFTNASGRFGDFTDMVEVAIDEMTEDEVKEFISYTTMHKDETGKVICQMTSEDMEHLADDSMTYIENDPKKWIFNWYKRNPKKPKVYMYYDALNERAFANIDTVGILFLYLTIFIYNGEVSEQKRIYFDDDFFSYEEAE